MSSQLIVKHSAVDPGLEPKIVIIGARVPRRPNDSGARRSSTKPESGYAAALIET
jgi:hypothetical protein